MVGIVSGNELGLLAGSPGTGGQSSLGRAGEQVFVNVATGNLIVHRHGRWCDPYAGALRL